MQKGVDSHRDKKFAGKSPFCLHLSAYDSFGILEEERVDKVKR